MLIHVVILCEHFQSMILLEAIVPPQNRATTDIELMCSMSWCYCTTVYVPLCCISSKILADRLKNASIWTAFGFFAPAFWMRGGRRLRAWNTVLCFSKSLKRPVWFLNLFQACRSMVVVEDLLQCRGHSTRSLARCCPIRSVLCCVVVQPSISAMRSRFSLSRGRRESLSTSRLRLPVLWRGSHSAAALRPSTSASPQPQISMMTCPKCDQVCFSAFRTLHVILTPAPSSNSSVTRNSREECRVAKYSLDE